VQELAGGLDGISLQKFLKCGQKRIYGGSAFKLNGKLGEGCKRQVCCGKKRKLAGNIQLYVRLHSDGVFQLAKRTQVVNSCGFVA